MNAPHPVNNVADREAFYKKIDGASMTPLWEVLHNIVTPLPQTQAAPHVWKWEKSYPWLLEAGGLISAMEAERRVLVLENPALRGKTRITNSLYAGLQLIMPGEVAPSTITAIRPMSPWCGSTVWIWPSWNCSTRSSWKKASNTARKRTLKRARTWLSSATP